ncbi:hypothetical protein CBR_g38601 [Chara braunii]|uniref:SWIM-type domain-containing protein n=1 Tax=Chara braunii TaxID=69332 RepID=A0A388K0P7_CHABU|nr:hypothetical protein CBR_g38601 [Chara braunii]|eukprot:GBG63533.1 hypothetical protein CBR_g38601 [Chara braunii]
MEEGDEGGGKSMNGMMNLMTELVMGISRDDVERAKATRMFHPAEHPTAGIVHGTSLASIHASSQPSPLSGVSLVGGGEFMVPTSQMRAVDRAENPTAADADHQQAIENPISGESLVGEGDFIVDTSQGRRDADHLANEHVEADQHHAIDIPISDVSSVGGGEFMLHTSQVRAADRAANEAAVETDRHLASDIPLSGMLLARRGEFMLHCSEMRVADRVANEATVEADCHQDSEIPLSGMSLVGRGEFMLHSSERRAAESAANKADVEHRAAEISLSGMSSVSGGKFMLHSSEVRAANCAANKAVAEVARCQASEIPHDSEEGLDDFPAVDHHVQEQCDGHKNGNVWLPEGDRAQNCLGFVDSLPQQGTRQAWPEAGGKCNPDATGMDQSLSDHQHTEASSSTGDSGDISLSPQQQHMPFVLPPVHEGVSLSVRDMGDVLRVGMEFETLAELRDAVVSVACQYHFEMMVRKSETRRYTVVCRAKDCTWRLHAAPIRGGPRFSIRVLQPHSCSGVMDHLGNKHATCRWVATRIAAQLRDHPTYRPVDIMSDLQRTTGVRVGYHTAWRGKEFAATSSSGSAEEEFSLLDAYSRVLWKTDPGSVCFMERNNTTQRIKRFFVAYKASLNGFAHCRPLLLLNRTHLKAKYPGILLTAIAIDAQDESFPIAFGVVDCESMETWEWFLLHLRYSCMQPALGSRSLTIVSDHDKGLVASMEAVLPDAHHAYCVRHLYASLARHHKHKDLQQLVWAAAQAMTETAYEEALQAMGVIDTGAVEWIRQKCPKEQWVTAFFPGERYGHFTADFCEAMSACLLVARKMPTVRMLESIHMKLNSWFLARHAEGMRMAGKIVPKKANLLQCEAANEGNMVAIEHTCTTHTVSSASSTHTVDIASRTCSCMKWQKMGVPCLHAACVLLKRCLRPEDYCSEYFTAEAYRSTYAGTVRPLPSSEWPGAVTADGAASFAIIPPTIQKPKVQSPKHCVHGSVEGRTVRAVHCSRCSKEGHTRRTCNKPDTGQYVSVSIVSGCDDGRVLGRVIKAFAAAGDVDDGQTSAMGLHRSGSSMSVPQGAGMHVVIPGHNAEAQAQNNGHGMSESTIAPAPT